MVDRTGGGGWSSINRVLTQHPWSPEFNPQHRINWALRIASVIVALRLGEAGSDIQGHLQLVI